MGRWDEKMKYLVNAAPEDFVSWLVKGAKYEGELSPHFASVDRDADCLWKIAIDRKPSLLHPEFQVKPDPNMGRRIWEYNAEASIKYKLPVESVVIYLKRPGSPQAVPPYRLTLPNGKVIHEFSFTVIEMCKLKAEDLFQTGLKGIFPLVPLTQNGQEHEAIERVIDELNQSSVKQSEELLSATYGLAGLVFQNPSDRRWLKRRFAMLRDILEESWTLQEIRQESLGEGLKEGLKEGLTEGLQKGRKEGLEEGLERGLQAQRQSLVQLIQQYYPALAQLAQDACNAMRVLEELQALFQKVLRAKDESEVRQLLLDA